MGVINVAIAYEANTDLAFDTEVLKKAAGEYKEVASDLRTIASKLDTLLSQLKDSGWTTPAGTSFHEMTQTNWGENIEKYASLLDSLNNILVKAANEYDELMVDYVRNTKVNL